MARNTRTKNRYSASNGGCVTDNLTDDSTDILTDNFTNDLSESNDIMEDNVLSKRVGGAVCSPRPKTQTGVVKPERTTVYDGENPCPLDINHFVSCGGPEVPMDDRPRLLLAVENCVPGKPSNLLFVI